MLWSLPCRRSSLSSNLLKLRRYVAIHCSCDFVQTYLQKAASNALLAPCTLVYVPVSLLYTGLKRMKPEHTQMILIDQFSTP